jgi:hypothetical protein
MDRDIANNWIRIRIFTLALNNPMLSGRVHLMANAKLESTFNKIISKVKQKFQ